MGDCRSGWGEGMLGWMLVGQCGVTVGQGG